MECVQVATTLTGDIHSSASAYSLEDSDTFLRFRVQVV